jgi:hypothetical protein
LHGVAAAIVCVHFVGHRVKLKRYYNICVDDC